MNKILAVILGLPLVLGISGAQGGNLYEGAPPMNAGDLSGATAMAAVDDTFAALGAVLGSSAFGPGGFPAGASSSGSSGGGDGVTSTDGSAGGMSSNSTTARTSTSSGGGGVQISSGSITTMNSRSVTEIKTQSN